MCGIFGAVFTSPGGHVDALAALEAIVHRGPDDRGLFAAPGATLGFVRLAILDLSPAGHQPMVAEDGRTAVVFNGEIYNHHELRAELVRAGHPFRSRSDTEVILRGYIEWGDRVVEKLDGMFALGVLDVARRRLLLARDRVGKKPLFWARDGQGLRFASEVKALVASGLPGDLEVGSLPFLFTFGYVPAPRTLYRGIEQVPPAHVLVLEEGREPAIARYWNPPFARSALDVGVEEATREVRRLVERAVVRRLEADVPLGAFLSGGIDSTIIVALMARHAKGRVKTFSIGFAQDARYDETRYARIAARAFGTDHTEFMLEPSSFELVDRLVEAHDGPFGDSSAIPTSVVSELTRRHVTVALTGDGGDELFCGYPRFLAVEASERIPAIARRLGVAVADLVPHVANDRAFVERARRAIARSALPLAERLLAWHTHFGFSLKELLREEVRRGIDVDAARAYNRAVVARSTGGTHLGRILQHNFETYLPDDLLVKSDRCSMMHSLELRSPFLDTALVDYVARLPDGFKRRGPTMKWILRRAFADLIPREIQTRPKMGFGIPLATWFRGDLRGYLEERFTAGASIYEYVEERYVRRLLEENAAGRADHGLSIWLLLTMELWLRRLRSSRGGSAGRP